MPNNAILLFSAFINLSLKLLADWNLSSIEIKADTPAWTARRKAAQHGKDY